MKTLATTLTLAALLLSAGSPTPAAAGRWCGRHRSRPALVRVQAAPVVVTCRPQPVPYATLNPTSPDATGSLISPQRDPGTPFIPPQSAPQASAVGPQTQAVASPAAVVGTPTYSYQAFPGGGPAYYYTYDKDDRLIPAQWMDWLFRGGREAGEPRPPLPIIGRL